MSALQQQRTDHDISDVLCCPTTGGSMMLEDGEYRSNGDPQVRFPVEDGIVRAFLPHRGAKTDVTETMKAFYEKTPFPNYDEMETVGSLIEKSLSRGFPEMLNRAIPPHWRVLEVGCGTGQLGNFLSIADRRVLSVDMCLNSLRLGQRFKETSGLQGVTFAQMNVFQLPLRVDTFDVVICTGVLHHTDDPYQGFRGLVRLVRRGGYVILGLYNRLGRMRTRLRRALSRVIGARVTRHDPYLRDHSVTGDKKQAWFMDQYRNPHESLHTMDEVLRWFRDEGVQFVRSLPSTIAGSRFELDYRHSLFDGEPTGSRMDRFLSQAHQALTDIEGGLFIMIGRKAGQAGT